MKPPKSKHVSDLLSLLRYKLLEFYLEFWELFLMYTLIVIQYTFNIIRNCSEMVNLLGC